MALSTTWERSTRASLLCLLSSPISTDQVLPTSLLSFKTILTSRNQLPSPLIFLSRATRTATRRDPAGSKGDSTLGQICVPPVSAPVLYTSQQILLFLDSLSSSRKKSLNSAQQLGFDVELSPPSLLLPTLTPLPSSPTASSFRILSGQS